MFSSRLPWDLRPNRLALLLEAKRRAGAVILDLTQSNPTQAGFVYPPVEILPALADPCSLRYEPAPAGLTPAREAVAAYYAARGSELGESHSTPSVNLQHRDTHPAQRSGMFRRSNGDVWQRY